MMKEVRESKDRIFINRIDILCTDTCWNIPSKKILKKGTKFKFTGTANNGDIFIKSIEDGNRYIISRTLAVKTRYPYDWGLYNTDLLKEV